MASSAANHLPAASQHPTPSLSAAQSVEDESRKKNTDCVYFLASPLTCKKGSECDFRHSEYARMNPRDCWYWINGSCLNPKCSFRHPPLDTLLGTAGDSAAGSSIPGPASAVAGSLVPPSHTVPSTPYVAAAKATAPCIYFQKGYCLKGDRCPFVHYPNPSGNKAPEFPTANVPESSRFSASFGVLQKCSQLKTAPPANVSKPIEVAPPQPRPSVHNMVKVIQSNGVFSEKHGMPQLNVSKEGLSKHNDTASRPLKNGNSRSKSGVATQVSSGDDQRFQSGKEADDLQRESSPGFDVLVEDDHRDDAYYGNDDQFPGIRSHEGRDHNEFDIGRSDRYKSLDDVDPSAYHDRHGYDKYKPLQRHARDSSERLVIEGSNYDRRGAYKGGNPDGTMNSDLRQRLSKQRRTNGLSSAGNPDYPSDIPEERRYRSSRRDSRHSPPRGSSISSRLQGRIRLPGQPSAVNPPSMLSEREYDKGRSHSRLSPTRPQTQSLRGRLQDRLRGRVQDDIGRDAVPLPGAERDVLDYNSSNPKFTAPKSLAELRKAKQPHSQSRELLKKSEEFNSVGRRRALESSQHSEDDISFEGPRPLSEILKRKRKAEDTEEVGITSKTAVEENKLKDSLSAPKQEANLSADVEESEVHNLAANTKIPETNNVFEAEEGQIEEGVVEVEGHDDDVEEEYYEGEEAVYEDEQDGGGEGYNVEEGENGDLPDDDYMEEDEEDNEEDNFAKKIGVMFS